MGLLPECAFELQDLVGIGLPRPDLFERLVAGQVRLLERDAPPAADEIAGPGDRPAVAGNCAGVHPGVGAMERDLVAFDSCQSEGPVALVP